MDIDLVGKNEYLKRAFLLITGLLVGPILCAVIMVLAEEDPRNKKWIWIPGVVLGPGFGLMIAWIMVTWDWVEELSYGWLIAILSYTVIYWGFLLQIVGSFLFPHVVPR